MLVEFVYFNILLQGYTKCRYVYINTEIFLHMFVDFYAYNV